MFIPCIPNDIDMFKVKNNNMYATYTPGAQIFFPFALRLATFELHPLFGKVHRMTPADLDMFKVKNTDMHATYIPEAQIVLRRAFFQLRPSFPKCAPNNPKWPWHVQGQNKNMHATSTPEPQIFIRFALRWAFFEVIEIFEFPIGYNIKLND